MNKIWKAYFEFSDFASHFYRMSDAEIVEDIRKSIDVAICKKIENNQFCFFFLFLVEAENKMEKRASIGRENIKSRWDKEQPEKKEKPEEKPVPKPKRPPNVSPDGEVIEPFIPPTIEQVQALCVEKRYPDPQGLAFRFFNFYAPDWKTGKGKRAKIMDSWPKALAGWVSRDNGVFRVPEFSDIQKYLTENCAKAGLDVDFVATQFLNKGTKEGWKGIRNWEAMLKQYVNTIVCSQSNKK